MELFDLAGALGPDVQAELSRLFRRRAVELVRDRPEPPRLFLNTHPVELERPGLLESLEELRTFAPQVDLVLEIHRGALAQTDFIAWLRGRLLEINVGLAYDDFGVGQARLFELAEAPPHYLKFDRRFVTGLDRAPTSGSGSWPRWWRQRGSCGWRRWRRASRRRSRRRPACGRASLTPRATTSAGRGSREGGLGRAAAVSRPELAGAQSPDLVAQLRRPLELAAPSPPRASASPGP